MNEHQSMTEWTPEQIEEMREEGRDAAGLRCGELCVKAADHIEKLQTQLSALPSPSAARDKALENAAKWFREYETGHREKGAFDKAERNRERAAHCEAALKSSPPAPASAPE